MKGLYADMCLVTVREESLITGNPNGGCGQSAWSHKASRDRIRGGGGHTAAL